MQPSIRPLGRLAVAGIKLYKKIFSPVFGYHCRFYPTCSSYSLECFQQFSFFRALWYSFRRILRCHPLAAGGFDPCPEPKQVSHE